MGGGALGAHAPHLGLEYKNIFTVQFIAKNQSLHSATETCMIIIYY